MHKSSKRAAGRDFDMPAERLSLDFTGRTEWVPPNPKTEIKPVSET